ncbi:hypothetical protein GCM10018954_098490 [Kutzneria kofuensis]
MSPAHAAGVAGGRFMGESGTRFQVVALEHRKLNRDALDQLAAAHISAGNETSRSELFRRGLGAPVDDLAVIDKCNAIMVAATFAVPTDRHFARDLLLRRWLDLAPGLGPHLPRVEHHCGAKAVEFLGEVAVGLHSVVLGDSQVYAQVVAGLAEARTAGRQDSAFTLLARRLRPLLHAVRTTTSLQQGNVSLERVACSRIARVTSARSVAVVGLGRTGRLIAEILGKETAHEVFACNRTPGKAGAAREVDWGDLDRIAEADVIVLCLTNTPETVAYAGKLFGHLTERHLLIDMSSPSITRQLDATTTAEVVGIDHLSEDAASNLSARKQSVNKARRIVGEWTEEVITALTAPPPVVSWRPPDDPGLLAHRARVLTHWRDQLAAEGFAEIQTPCLVPADLVTEGLARRRSAQLHHQLAVVGGMDKVYEIGPVWDGEETTMLQVEMRAPVDLSDLARRAVDLVRLAVPMADGPASTLDYGEALDRLNRAGHDVDYGIELSFAHRRLLGDLIGERVFVVTNHPASRQRFAAARGSAVGRTATFDVVLDGHRVGDGGLHETDSHELRKQVALAGLPAQRYDSFIAHLDQAPPHGGFRLSLDRLTDRSRVTQPGREGIQG